MLNYWRVNTETPGKKTTDPAVIKHGNGDFNGSNHLINSGFASHGADYQRAHLVAP